jgi:hypothetical protein
MSDIFISYLSEDRDRILPLVNALEKTGWSVFWNRMIPPGGSWRQVIGSAIQNSRAMVVVWTEKSIQSEWVQEEAHVGRRKGILFSVLLDNVEPPFGFGLLQSANLAAWNNDSSYPIFIQLIESIATLLGPGQKTLIAEEPHRAREEQVHKQKPQQSENISKIFISYRRDDSAGYAHAIQSRLVQHFSKDQVFMDVDSVEPGVDFVHVIEEAVGECDILLAVIGNKWAKESNGAKSRLDDPEDFVRLEISTALARDIRVIPVLVDGMKMPSEETLPALLKPLTRRNAMEISHTRFDYDVERVATAVRRVLGEKVQEGENELLKHLRKQMLIAGSARELRRNLYELEDYLSKNPHSPEARSLKDEMEAAIRHPEVAAQRSEDDLIDHRMSAPRPFRWLLLLVLASLTVILYVLVKFGYF